MAVKHAMRQIFRRSYFGCSQVEAASSSHQCLRGRAARERGAARALRHPKVNR